jgi:Flp pilus assembly protein TadD
MDDGIDLYGKVDQSSPARLGALLRQQQAYLKLGEPEKALQYSEQATRLAPLDQRVLIARGVTLDLLGRHTQAQERIAPY